MHTPMSIVRQFSRLGRLREASLPLLLGVALTAAPARAQEVLTGTPEILVTPVSPTWTYPVGMPAAFSVDVRRDGHPLPGVTVTVRCGPEMLPPTLTKEVTSGRTPVVIDAGTMPSPGWRKCASTSPATSSTLASSMVARNGSRALWKGLTHDVMFVVSLL